MNAQPAPVTSFVNIKKAADDRLKQMIRDGHPNRLLCLQELRSRYESRTAKLLSDIFANAYNATDTVDSAFNIVMDRCREVVLYEMVCNIHDQFGE
jgi:hypothetical protein